MRSVQKNPRFALLFIFAVVCFARPIGAANEFFITTPAAGATFFTTIQQMNVIGGRNPAQSEIYSVSIEQQSGRFWAVAGSGGGTCNADGSWSEDIPLGGLSILPTKVVVSGSDGTEDDVHFVTVIAP